MNVLIFAAALAIPLSSPVPAIEPNTPRLTGARVAMYTAAALDIVSTKYVLANGGRETNALLGRQPSTGKLLAFKAVMLAVNDATGQYLLRKGKVGQAKFVYWFAAGVGFLASAWNFQIVGG
jgi:hypothetical protein